MAGKIMTLKILTLNWNGLNNLKELSDSLLPSINKIGNVEWYVRDNGSKDGSVEWIKDQKHIELFSAGHNRDNFSQGINSLYRLSNPKSEDLVLLLNNDVVFKDSVSIEKMINLHKQTKAEIVGSRLLFKNTNKLQHAGVIFSNRYNSLPYHFRPGEESDKHSEKNRWFQVVTAACMLTTPSAFERVGGLDSNYSWAFDDVAYCLKVTQTSKIHKKVAYCGETDIYHEESASLKKNPVNKLYMNKNVGQFRKDWTGKYEIDHDKYLTNNNYNLI